jgi:probable phosphoglycerate mutase
MKKNHKISLFLIRHGETDWNKRHCFQGKKDIPLNQTGLIQAELLAKRLKNFFIERIYTSPLKRAKVTAEIIAKELKLKFPLSKFGLKEIDHGLWEGKTEDEVKNKYSELLKIWYNQPHLIKMPQGENLKSVKNRAVACILNILKEVTNQGYQRIAIVSHEAVNKIILCYLLSLPLRYFWLLPQSNASFSLIEINYEKKSPKKLKAKLISLNDTCHLQKLDDKFYNAESR